MAEFFSFLFWFWVIAAIIATLSTEGGRRFFGCLFFVILVLVGVPVVVVFLIYLIYLLFMALAN